MGELLLKLTAVLSPWEADGQCLFGLSAVNVCARTHTHAHTGGRGWLAPLSLPSVLILTCKAFLFSVFHFLLLSVKILRAN